MSRIISFLDWIGRFQVVQAILQYLWTVIPIGWLVGTGVAGVMTGQPFMWIMVAVAASAAFITVAILAGMLIQIWKEPQDKLKFVQANVGLDLVRHGASKFKKISKAQIMVQLKNDAHFPISVYVEKAETSLENSRPPRPQFPRKKTTIGASGVFYIVDEPIDMKLAKCEDMTGDVDFLIKYGNPGNEKYSLSVRGTVSITMDAQGLVKGIWFNHHGSDITLPAA